MRWRCLAFALLAIVASQIALALGDSVDIVVVDPAVVQIQSYPQVMVVGSMYSVAGRLMRIRGASLQPVAGSIVYLEESLDGGATWKEVSSAPTADDGAFSVPYTPKVLGAVNLRVRHKPNTGLRLGESVSETISLTVTRRTLSIDLSNVPRQVLTSVTYSFTLTVSDALTPPLDWDRCFTVSSSFVADDSRIHSVRYSARQQVNLPIICSDYPRYSVSLTISFLSAGTKRFTVTASGEFHEATTQSIDIEVVKQVPILRSFYVVEHVPGAGVRVSAVFREVDDDPAVGLPIASVKVDGVEVLQSPVSTDSTGASYFVIPSNLFSPGKQVVITTLDTERYAGQTYVTTISEKRPVDIRAELESTYAGFSSTLTVVVADFLTGAYVEGGTVRVEFVAPVPGVVFVASEPLAGAPLRITVPAYYVRGGVATVTVTFSNSPTHQDTKRVFQFSVAFRPVVLSASYRGGEVEGVYRACDTYGFEVTARDGVLGEPVGNLPVSAVVRSNDGRSLSNTVTSRTDSSGSAVLHPYIGYTGRTPAVVSFWVDDPEKVYSGSVNYPVEVWGCQYVKAVLWLPYELRVSVGSGLQGVRVDLYSCGAGWERVALTSTTVPLAGEATFTLTERGSPGNYLYEAEVVRGGAVVYVHRFVVDARYMTKIVNVDHVPKPVYASTSFTLLFDAVRWENGEWVPALDSRVRLLEHYEHHSFVSSSIVSGISCIVCHTFTCGALTSAVPRFLGEVSVQSNPVAYTVHAYRWGGVAGHGYLQSPPITLELRVVEDPQYWSSTTMYYVSVEPLSFYRSPIVVEAYNSLTRESYKRSFPAYSFVDDPISLTSSDPLRITVLLRTHPVQVDIPVFIRIDHQYCRGDVNYCCGRRSLFNGVVYTNQPYVFNLYLLPGAYSRNCAGTGFGSIVITAYCGDLLPCGVTIFELANVRVESSGKEHLRVLVSTSNPIVYKRSDTSITFTGLVFGDSGELLPNTQVEASIRTSNNRVLYSWKTKTDANGYFVLTIPGNLNLDVGKYRFVVVVPTRPDIRSYEVQFVVAPPETKMVVVTAPQYVISGNSYAVSVNAFVGDPVPLPNHEVDVWYSNVVYSYSEPISWTKLGTVVTDDGGVSVANVPNTATVLSGNASMGWMYVFAALTEVSFDPNRSLSDQTKFEGLSVAKVYILRKEEDIQNLLNEVVETPETGENVELLGGVALSSALHRVAPLVVLTIAMLVLVAALGARKPKTFSYFIPG